MGPSDAGSETTTEMKTPEQKAMIKRMMALYGDQLGVNKTYEGERVAPFTDTQRNVLSGAENFLPTFSSPQTVGQPLSGETGTAIQGLLSGQTGAQKMTSQNVDDYFNQTLRDPTMTTLRKDTLPGVDESFAGPGFFGSARSNARVDTTQDTTEWLGEQRAGLNWDVLNQNNAIDEAKAGRTLSTLPAAMQYGNQPAQNAMNNLQIAASQVQGLGSLFGFGEAEQTQEQQVLTSAFQKFLEQNQITDPTTLNILMQLIGQSITTTQEFEPSNWKAEQWGSLGLKAAGSALMAGSGGGGAAGVGGQGSSVGISGSSFANPQAVYGAPAGY